MEAPHARVFGLKPWFPWPLSRWRWLTDPVRAERLAVLRVGVALILLVEVLFTFYPQANDLFGEGSLAEPPLHIHLFGDGRWSVFENVLGEKPITNPGTIQFLDGLVGGGGVAPMS